MWFVCGLSTQSIVAFTVQLQSRSSPCWPHCADDCRWLVRVMELSFFNLNMNLNLVTSEKTRWSVGNIFLIIIIHKNTGTSRGIVTKMRINLRRSRYSTHWPLAHEIDKITSTYMYFYVSRCPSAFLSPRKTVEREEGKERDDCESAAFRQGHNRSNRSWGGRRQNDFSIHSNHSGTSDYASFGPEMARAVVWKIKISCIAREPNNRGMMLWVGCIWFI